MVSLMIREKELLVESLENQIQAMKDNTPKNPLLILNQHYIRIGWKHHANEVQKRTGGYVIQFEILNAYTDIELCQKIP